MTYDVNPVEYGRMLNEISRLNDDVKEGKLTIKELIERLDELEQKARQNEQDHKNFVRHTELQGIEDSLKKLENSIVVMTPKQAQAAVDRMVKEGRKAWLLSLYLPKK